MSRRVISQDFYDRLVAAFRQDPGNASAAARYAKCDPRTAKKGWERGWPEVGAWAKPINERLAEEQQEARSRLAQTHSETFTREAARENAITVREQEGHIVAGARSNSFRLMQASEKLLIGIDALASRVSHELQKYTEAIGVDPKTNRPIYRHTIDAQKATRLMQSVSSALRQGNESALIAMRMERLHLGEPESILGLKDMTIQKAAQDVERGTRAVKRARKRGLFTVIEGGGGEASEGQDGSGGKSDDGRRATG